MTGFVVTTLKFVVLGPPPRFSAEIPVPRVVLGQHMGVLQDQSGWVVNEQGQSYLYVRFKGFCANHKAGPWF